MALSRRHFLQRGSLLAASSVIPLGCSDGSDNLSQLNKTAVIIGSGFGGSVAALRLGLAGIPTIVLERGQQWTVNGPDTFPTTRNLDRRATWNISSADAADQTPAQYAGLLETIPGANVSAVCGAGVGGGSLVYGGVLIQPDRQVFEDVFPYLSYDAMDSVFYPRVIETIGASPIPDDVLDSPNYHAHRIFLRDAAALGYRSQRPNTSFDWDIIRQEIAGEIPPAASVGEYAFGCNSNAKLSTDKNYLQRAINTGFVELRSLSDVEIISEREGSGYSVVVRTISAEGELRERYQLDADYVFMAAGSMNTSKLLLKSQLTGELKGQNSGIGKIWGTNGDQLLAQGHPDISAGFQGGPACVASIDTSNTDYPVTFMHSPQSVAPVQLQLAMSIPDETGQLAYDSTADSVKIEWDSDSATPSAQARQASFDRLVSANGGMEVPFIRGQIWHPLGGAVMNEACDELGQLYGYRNLFVVDGSTLPGSAATVNPALTVAANAERIMAALLPIS